MPSAGGAFAHRYDWHDVTLVLAHNLSREPVRTTLEVDGLRRGDDLLGDADPAPAGGESVNLELPPYGYRWLRVSREGQRTLPEPRPARGIATNRFRRQRAGLPRV